MYQEATNSYAKNDAKQLYKVVKKLSGKPNQNIPRQMSINAMVNHPQPKKNFSMNLQII